MHIARQLLAVHGPVEASKVVLGRVLKRNRNRAVHRVQFLPHPYDLANGTDTGGLIRGIDLLSGHSSDVHTTSYYGIAPSVFRQACHLWLSCIQASNHTVENYTFIDIGAGKGRALLLASELAFRHIIGVELNPQLAAAARDNLAIWNRADREKARIQVVQEDALQYVWPESPLLVYLFNPFGETVLKSMIEKLLASVAQCSRSVYLLYLHPEQWKILEDNPSLQKLADEHFKMDEDDRTADLFAEDGMYCHLYRVQLQP